MGIPDDDSDTGPHGLRRAVRDTQQTARGTSDRVDGLRDELGRRINRLEGKVDGLDGKVDQLGIASARIEGAVGVLTEEARVNRNGFSEVRVGAIQARIEVEKTGEIAKLNEEVARRSDRRQLPLKIVAVLGPIATAALAWLLARC